ncbi:flagellar basal-body MS-ring/collar protein FliF [Salinarimonas rosea]|uniref:flagellar basal-body MS-ring/collar protein FliF n=1 Tax=Salinarimonas rosea TaxID=552063 RepID=UPI0012EB1599|nr:flagellar basal-body MS-ring/collar protein FliF [Salinarimonas rosea]
MNQTMEILSRLGPARLAVMGAVTLALVGFFAFVIMRMSQPDMGVLYADLSMADAGAVVRELEARGIAYETRGDGVILAPRSDLARLRMELASDGLPAGTGVGYEIFDRGDSFSSTSFVQNINQLRALEGELSRTIASLARVEAARVHLAIPERRLFERDREDPRASIVLRVRGELDQAQVRAVRHLVATAVEGLRPDRISIVDESGRLLADGATAGDSMAAVAADETRIGFENRLRAQVEDIVAGIVGRGRTRVQVAAEFDTNRVEARSETFDPNGQVARSMQTRTDNAVSTQGDAGVTVGNELPGGGEDPEGGGMRDQQETTEETINYEISRSTRVEMLEGPRLSRLSVAVLVDGAYATGPDGSVAYEPRTAEELQRIEALVRTAIGFDADRGDQIEVVNLRFAEGPQPEFLPEEPTLVESLLNPTREDVLRAVELAVLFLLSLVVIFTVLRPMLRAFTASPVMIAAGAGGGEAGAIAGGEGGGTPALPSRSDATSQMIEMAKVNGQVQQESLERVADLVKQSPSETVSVMRQWIHERG